jgi:hypothetical protein
MSDLGQWSHRGNDDGMSGLGDLKQHGKPQVVRARDSQPGGPAGSAPVNGLCHMMGVANRSKSLRRVLVIPSENRKTGLTLRGPNNQPWRGHPNI